MISNLLKMLSYPFMQRALVVGILVSLCAALLGVSLVLKRYSMIGDGLSHVGFGSLAIAAALGFAPLAFTIPVVVLAAFLLLRMNESSKIKGDAAIGLISSSALSIPERLRGRRSMHKKITFHLSLILWRHWPTQTRSMQSTSPAPISAMLPRAS